MVNHLNEGKVFDHFNITPFYILILQRCFLLKQRKQQPIPQPVTEIVPKPLGPQPIFLKLDKILCDVLKCYKDKRGT